MFVTLNEILDDAKKNKYAIPAFDVSNYEMIKCVAEVCEEEKSPALFMCLQPDLDSKGMGFLTSMIKEVDRAYNIPVCLHLDHSEKLEHIMAAVDAGFSSVMFDGSSLPFQENASKTKEIVDYAHSKGVSVEAELGHVGNAIAGNNSSAEDAVVEDPYDTLTIPSEVEEFVNITNVDALAVAVGTSHGVYKSTPVLAYDRLEEIRNITDAYLVLHGGSGTPDESVKKAVELGITKINVYSEVLNALHVGLKDTLESIDNMSMWPIYTYKQAKENMKEIIRNKIRVFGSVNRI